MTQQTLVTAIGWGFLLLSVFWPTKRWGGRVIRIAFSALATGVFLANMVYSFL
jgi:hypothetical protein